MWLASTGCGDLFINRQLGHQFAIFHSRFEPGKKLTQCRAVLFHGLSHIRNLGLVFDGFEALRRIEFFDQ